MSHYFIFDLLFHILLFCMPTLLFYVLWKFLVVPLYFEFEKICVSPNNFIEYFYSCLMLFKMGLKLFISTIPWIKQSDFVPMSASKMYQNIPSNNDVIFDYLPNIIHFVFHNYKVPIFSLKFDSYFMKEYSIFYLWTNL